MDLVLDEPTDIVLQHDAEAPRPAAASLRLTVRFDGHTMRRWHVDLLERIFARGGIALSVELAAAQARPLPGLAALCRIETALHGLPANGLSAPAPAGALAGFARGTAAEADLVLDLQGEAASGQGRLWTLTFDGVPGEAALHRALLDGRTSRIEIREGARIVAAARIGTEAGGILCAALDDTLARLTTLILAALSDAASASLPVLPDEHDVLPAAPQRTVAAFAAKALIRTAIRQIYRACYHAPHWRTGWRRLDGPDLFDLRRHPDTGWRDLPDDGARFYADPFPIVHDGGVTLFVEEFEHQRGKGIISAVDFGPEGPRGRPVPVLEQPGHLSYPFVFAHDGAMWMIPESGSAGTVDLFRSTAFPGGWVKERTLIAGLVASDATMLRHAGLWWMFATVRDGGGAFSDALHLWSARDLLGPWTPHPRNPVLIDIASARPAGRFVERGGALLRPVQDCRRGYGAALGIARVTRLDPEGFEQVVETILTSGPLWPGRRLHTLNQAGGFEFIDGSAYAPRWHRRTA